MTVDSSTSQVAIAGRFRIVLMAAASLAVLAALAAPDALAQRRQTPAALWSRATAQTRADSAVVLLRHLADTFPRHPLAREAQIEIADYYFSLGEYPQAAQRR